MPDSKKLNSRKLKKLFFDKLEQDNWLDNIKNEIEEYEPKLMPILFSALYSASERIRWNAISCFGFIAKKMPSEDIEKLRIIIRRCIWNLTEEAGSLAWGAPEVIGEIMANNEQMAKEYYQILYSYIFDNPDGPDNYLEFDELRKGVFWGLARLAQKFPEIARKDANYLMDRYGLEENSDIVAILCWASGMMALEESRDFLNKCKQNKQRVTLYKNYNLENTTIASLAEEALKNI